MWRIIGGLIFLAIVGVTGFYVLKNYFPNLAPPSKDIKQFLPLNEHTGSSLKVPRGTKLDVFFDLRGELPTGLTIDGRGTLLASLKNVGKVVALPDFDRNNKAEKKVEILKGLKKPEGITIHDQYLYVVEANKVSRYQYNKDTFGVGTNEFLFDIPTSENLRHIKIEDGRLNISDGLSIISSNLDGSGFSVVTDNSLTAKYKPLGQTTDNNGNVFVSSNYQVIKLRTFAGSVSGEEYYIIGFIQGTNEILGRPTGLAFSSEGSLYIADDKTGLIYILTK